MDSKTDGILDTAAMRLWKLEDGTLVLKYLSARGERKALVSPPRRALPLSNPEQWIVFSDHDGAEIGMLASIDDLDEGSQAVLREALRNEYSLERIVRVLEVEREPLSGQTRWRVEIESADEDAPVEASNRDGSKLASTSEVLESETQSEITADETSDSDGDERLGARGKVASLLSLGRDKSAAEDAISTVEREFTIAGQEDVQTARYPHIFIVDTDRRRYEILDCEALDVDSRKAAERFF
jgi:hypothetical protein